MSVNLELSYLNTDQVQAGDLMLKYGDGSAISKVITFGQNLFQKKGAHGNNNIVHAGIMLDGDIIIESQGSGVSANDLRVQNKQYDYEVYRCLLTNVAEGAATAAKIVFDAHANSKNAKYSLAGAAASLVRPGKAVNPRTVDTTINRLTTGKGHSFFCSQFAVYCFQLAAEQNGLPAQSLFDLNDANYSPTKLKESLFKSHYFYKAGMLRAGIR